MKGVVKYERGSGFVELRDVEEKPPAPNQVKIEVKAAGICGSDLHILHDTINFVIRTPVVIGHEFSGVVVDKGADVGEEVRLGDRVTAEATITACGQCDFCRTECYNLCPERRVIGYYHDGCFAGFCNAVNLHPLPDNVSFEAGALTEPLACCVHTVIEQTGISAGDFVVVLGPGPIGVLAALVARAEGGSVMLCGTSRDRERLRVAREAAGIECTVNVDDSDPVEMARESTGGYGADVVIECSGAAPALSQALEIVRKRGKVTQFGLFGRPVEVDFEKIAYKELTVSGGIAHRRPSWKRALHLMERGVIQPEKLITHEMPLAEWSTGFELLERQEAMKILLRP